MQRKLSQYWYQYRWHPFILALLPLSWLFGLTTAVRRCLYRTGMKKTHHFSVPVIVVGNITVGGTGKTPFVIWLATWLQAQGYLPGIVSRGVGGEKHHLPYRVMQHDQVEKVGDEALLLKRHTHCPVVICIDRVAAVADLLQHTSCNIVISDDGLQHYRLARNLEIALIDTTRLFGNEHLLPAGPLREPLSRLDTVDFVVMNGRDALTDQPTMSFLPAQFVSLIHPQQTLTLADFANKTVHAVAGIGHPERFFSQLKNAGLHVIPHVFPDHYLYQPDDIHFADSFPVIMTEKDAVKCREFANERHWYLSMTTHVNAKFTQALLERLKQE